MGRGPSRIRTRDTSSGTTASAPNRSPKQGTTLIVTAVRDEPAAAVAASKHSGDRVAAVTAQLWPGPRTTSCPRARVQGNREGSLSLPQLLHPGWIRAGHFGMLPAGGAPRVAPARTGCTGLHAGDEVLQQLLGSAGHHPVGPAEVVARLSPFVRPVNCHDLPDDSRSPESCRRYDGMDRFSIPTPWECFVALHSNCET